MDLSAFFPPWHDLVISPLCRTYPINFPQKVCPLTTMENFFKKRGFPILYEKDAMLLHHWKIMWRSALKLVNILEFGRDQSNEVLYKNWNVVITNPFGHSIMFPWFYVKLVNTCKMHCWLNYWASLSKTGEVDPRL